MTHTDLSQHDGPASQTELDPPASQDRLDAPASQDQLDAPASQTELDSPVSQDQPDAPASQTELDPPVSQDQLDDPAESPGTTSTEQSVVRSPADDQTPPAQLLAPEDLEVIVGRWREIQADFVDEPRRAVRDADALVKDLMQRLTQMFAAEREELESRWMADDDVSTEDLRQGLRRYRSFFERLLKV